MFSRGERVLARREIGGVSPGTRGVIEGGGDTGVASGIADPTQYWGVLWDDGRRSKVSETDLAHEAGRRAARSTRQRTAHTTAAPPSFFATRHRVLAVVLIVLAVVFFRSVSDADNAANVVANLVLGTAALALGLWCWSRPRPTDNP
jgi:hypothetical protein